MRRPRTVFERFRRASAACLVLSLSLATLFIFCFGFWLVYLRCGPTFYAPGFTEARFASLREGMTTAETEALIGPPLKVIPQGEGTTLWTYSNRDDDTCDFEMRWVYFQDGRAKHVVGMHWTE